MGGVEYRVPPDGPIWRGRRMAGDVRRYPSSHRPRSATPAGRPEPARHLWALRRRTACSLGRITERSCHRHRSDLTRRTTPRGSGARRSGRSRAGRRAPARRRRRSPVSRRAARGAPGALSVSFAGGAPSHRDPPGSRPRAGRHRRSGALDPRGGVARVGPVEGRVPSRGDRRGRGRVVPPPAGETAHVVVVPRPRGAWLRARGDLGVCQSEHRFSARCDALPRADGHVRRPLPGRPGHPWSSDIRSSRAMACPLRHPSCRRRQRRRSRRQHRCAVGICDGPRSCRIDVAPRIC